MVAGMTGSGKTVRAKSASAGSKSNPPTTREGCLVLFAMAACVHGTLVTIPNIESVKGIPSDLEHYTFFDINKRNLTVIDDQMDNAGADKGIVNLFYKRISSSQLLNDACSQAVQSSAITSDSFVQEL